MVKSVEEWKDRSVRCGMDRAGKTHEHDFPGQYWG